MAKKRNATGPTAKSTSSPTTVTATIDLHGYRKSQAIIALTSFLDQVVSRQRKQRDGAMKDVWVLVITGSGAHSPDGPVLRNSVEALLQKRQMQFITNRGRGSFNVKANSGIVFYEPDAPRDTKVIVKNAPETIPALPKPPKISNLAQVALDYGDDAPTPCEVVATEKAIEESRKDQQEVLKDQKKDEKLLKRAVSMSLLQAQKEDKEEQEIMQRALSLSLLDSQSNIDDDLQRALELSQKEFEHFPDENEELQKALELSQKISSRDDDELLQILELSKNEYKETESWTIGFSGEVDEVVQEYR